MAAEPAAPAVADPAPAVPFLSLRRITKVFGEGDAAVHALQEVDLEIHAGEFVAIMGSSGSGKSTAMNILGCLDAPTSGQYLMEGIPVESLSADVLAALRNDRIGFVFQGFNLLPRTSALANVELPLIYANVPARERVRRARRALADVGLAGREDARPNQLSGGQQQRVAIARALVNEPELLLADEPTGNLDSRTGAEIMALLTGLNRDRGITIVIVTHDLEIAGYARRRVVFRDGSILSDGLPHEVPEAAS
jgi:putative ABC transport system ATP-binding protein